MVHSSTPEEDELVCKNRELIELEAELVTRELELTALRAELHRFELEYLNSIGSKYVELDRLEAKIADVLASREPLNDALRQNSEETRAQSERSSDEFIGKRASRRELERRSNLEEEEIKKLYRDLAKKIHPDLTDDEASRELRERLMAQANAAYRQGDKDTLLGILSTWNSDERAVSGGEVAHQLVRAIRRAARIRHRIDRIKDEISALQCSQLAQLRNRVEEERLRGGDLLSKLAGDIEKRIATTRARLEWEEKRL
jgi:hypothetical protein